MFVNDQVILHVVFEDSRFDLINMNLFKKRIISLLDYLIEVVELHHLISDYVVQVRLHFVHILLVMVQLFNYILQ